MTSYKGPERREQPPGDIQDDNPVDEREAGERIMGIQDLEFHRKQILGIAERMFREKVPLGELILRKDDDPDFIMKEMEMLFKAYLSRKE